MTEASTLKAVPRFEKLIGASGGLALTALALVMVGANFGLGTITAFIVAFGFLIWVPLSLLVAYLNRPDVTLTDQGILVRPEHRMGKGVTVPYSRCWWRVDKRGWLVLRLFPYYYSVTKVGTRPHRVTLELAPDQLDLWLDRLRDGGAQAEHR